VAKILLKIKTIANSPSRSLFIILLAFGFSVIGSALFLKQIDELYLIVPTIIFVAIFFLIRTAGYKFLAAIIFVIFLGALRFNQSFIDPNQLSVLDYVGRETVMSGVIKGELVARESSQEAKISELKISDQEIQGDILVRLPQFQKFSVGDILEFRCQLTRPEAFNGFDYLGYLESRGVYAICYQPEELTGRGNIGWRLENSLIALRAAMINKLGQIFPEPHAAFMSGVLFGGSQGLSTDMKGDFSKTGLSHVMAASGYNVSIFSQLLLVILMRSVLGRRRALVVSSVLIVLYVFLAGGTPPVVRAGIMASTVMLGSWFRRTPHGGNLLLLSGCLMLFVSPRLVSDVGFQLSFAATGGLMLLGSWFGDRTTFIPDVFGLRESCSASLAAISATLPIMLWHFGSTSLIAPLVNLLILLWIPYLMLLGGIALAIGWLSVPLGALMAVPASALSGFILLLVTWFGSVSFASIALPKTLSAILALMFFIFMLYLTRSKKNIKDKSPKFSRRHRILAGPRQRPPSAGNNSIIQ